MGHTSVEESESTDCIIVWIVIGRGILKLAVMVDCFHKADSHARV